jgi:hypothetical protein
VQSSFLGKLKKGALTTLFVVIHAQSLAHGGQVSESMRLDDILPDFEIVFTGDFAFETTQYKNSRRSVRSSRIHCFAAPGDLKQVAANGRKAEPVSPMLIPAGTRLQILSNEPDTDVSNTEDGEAIEESTTVGFTYNHFMQSLRCYSSDSSGRMYDKTVNDLREAFNGMMYVESPLL